MMQRCARVANCTLRKPRGQVRRLARPTNARVASFSTSSKVKEQAKEEHEEMAQEDYSKKVTALKEAWMVPERKDNVIPTYRVLNERGEPLNPKEVPKLSKEELLKCYTGMVTLSEMDKVLYDVQRQGLISFYMTSFGEEATHFGSAAALTMDDVVYGQYRESGVLLYRGFTVQDCVNQCYSNQKDLGKGRQMPIHYGSKSLNFQTISSPLGTQIPQAAGAGYAFRIQKKDACVICYFGDGAASEGDFHAAVNFAATLNSATIFFCRNNKWAISTPSREQYKGDAIAGRGVAYGIHTVRVDGNDLFAVYNATKEARRICVEEGKPVLIEAMTYRIGHHSTSDDWTRYRKEAEVTGWQKDNNPITRLAGYLQSKGWLTQEFTDKLKKDTRANVINAMKIAEREKKPNLQHLFTDVYDKLPPNLIEQQAELQQHLAKYPDKYPTNLHSDI